MKRPEWLTGDGAISGKPLSVDERRRMRLCRVSVYAVPLLTAATSFSIIRVIGPIRPATEWQAWTVIAGNGILATLIPAIGVALWYPTPARRWRRGAITAAICPFLYLLSLALLALLIETPGI
jgi:hypothetical protein